MKKHSITLSAMKRIIFLVIIISFFALQFIILPKTALPVPLLLLIPVTVAVAMHENELGAMLWGLLSGILWDMASPVTDGLYALIFSVIFLLTGLWARYLLRNTCLTAAIFTAVFSLIPSFLGIIYMKEKLTGELISAVIKAECIPAVITSLIILVPVYFLISAISRFFTRERV
ncbi:MAG: rod shape-determining protein MreD [Clostridia bacterium]|nr:rod shape-determining protein MreD [Clostridia bacterium]